MNTPPSVLVGLIGASIQPSLTPAMHEREGAALGLSYVYKRIDLEVLRLGAEALPDLLTAAERMGFAGLNITFPCKQSVIAHLHELSPEAKNLGAVNTVVFKQGRRIGYNTDGWGFAESFRRELPDVPRKRIVQFGAGGAGAAVAHAVLELGAGTVTLIDSDHARAVFLAGELCARFGAGRAAASRDAEAEVARADGIINTTPMGMAKYPGMAFPPQWLRAELWVADVVYFPLETELLWIARAHGCRTMSGAGMVVLQAARAFEHFSGRRADAERMFAHFAELTKS